MVVSEGVSVGCNVAKFVAFSNSEKRPNESKGKFVAFLKTNSAFRVELSPEVSKAVFSVKSAGFSKVVSSKLSVDSTRVEVSGLREEGDFPCEFVVAYVL